MAAGLVDASLRWTATTAPQVKAAAAANQAMDTQ